MAHATASIGTVDYRATIVTGAHKAHTITADEGSEPGGQDTGPAPYDLLTSSLGACTSTVRMYAQRKLWPVTSVTAEIYYVREGDLVRIDRSLFIEGADSEQKKRMAEIAERTPVTLTLKKGLQIQTRLG